MYIKHPVFILVFAANVGLLQSSGTDVSYGYSSFLWLSIAVVFLYALKGLIFVSIDKVSVMLGLVGLSVLGAGLAFIETISSLRILVSLLLAVFIITLSKLPVETIDKFGREYVRKTQYLLIIAFCIYLASQLGFLTLYRFVSWGTRFGGFSYELVEHVIVCTTALLILLSSPGSVVPRRYYRIAVVFLIASILLAQSNMIYIVLLSWIQILVFKHIGIRHQSMLLIVGLVASMFILSELLYGFFPSVRGGGADVVERFRGAEQLLYVMAEKVQVFSFEFFQLERTCLNSTGTNNFGFLNVYCDFGLFGLMILLSIFFALERYYSCESRQGYCLSILAAFSINAILIVPYYYSPTILFALIYSIRKLSQEKQKRRAKI